jgi:hypothetical protein
MMAWMYIVAVLFPKASDADDRNSGGAVVALLIGVRGDGGAEIPVHRAYSRFACAVAHVLYGFSGRAGTAGARFARTDGRSDRG